jgi:elongation factor G
VVDFLPCPVDLPPAEAHHSKKEEKLEVPCSESGYPLGLIFKVQVDREAGSLCFVRMYSGSIKTASTVYNVGKKKRERVTRILRMHANKSEAIDEIKAGDIAVIVGMKLAQTGDTIGTEGWPVLLEKMNFPVPVISVAIEPKTMSDRDKLRETLETLSKEDPTFTTREDGETGQLVISGMGELHLDVLVTRILREFKIGAKVGNPQVTYRETITKEATHSESFRRTMAGKENAADVTIKVSPLPRGSGNRFEVGMRKPANVPEEIVEAIERGVTGAFQSGIMFGYPSIDILATLTDMKYDELAGSEFAFEACAAMGFDTACREASPVMLEPVMKVELSSPSDFVGEVMSLLTQRGGIIHRMESKPSQETVHAEAPLSVMFGFSTSLRSVSQGRASFSMEFSHFEEKRR